LAERIAKDGKAAKGGGAAARSKPPEPKAKAPSRRRKPGSTSSRTTIAKRRVARAGLISALEAEGIADADSLVRRDVMGNQPVVAARLLARDILAAVGRASKPESVIEAVVDVLGARRRGAASRVGSWSSGDGPNGEPSRDQTCARDLRDAADTGTTPERNDSCEQRATRLTPSCRTVRGP
jgi:hypothetical protein